MASKESRTDEKQSEAREEGADSLRSLLMNKVKGEETAGDKGGGPGGDAPKPDEDNAGLNRTFSIGNPGPMERAAFCRQFATLIEVGIPMLKALQILGRRTYHGRLRRAIDETARAVEEGQTIHGAMSANTGVFSPLVVKIVRVGEVGGILEDSLTRLADIMESKVRIRRKIVSASLYPMVVLCVAFFVIGIIMVKAIPTFKEVYASANSLDKLPNLTKNMIAFSDFVSAYWGALLIGAAVLFVALLVFGKIPLGARVYSWLGMNIPMLSSLNRKIAVARSTRTLGSLLTAGIPLVEALGIAADTNENVIVADALRGVQQEVEKGERMTDHLANARVFPPVVTDMIGIGEETGTLDRMLNKVADVYDDEVNTTLAGLTSIMEPLLIIVLGGIVMLIALAALMPYFNMAKMV